MTFLSVEIANHNRHELITRCGRCGTSSFLYMSERLRLCRSCLDSARKRKKK